MKILLIINIILLAVSAVALTISFTQLIKIERELAEFDKSSIFKNNNDKTEA